MATKETPAIPPLPPISPELRRIAAERFDRANQVIAGGDYDYGIQLLLACCKLDPGNFLFRQTLRKTQKAKFGNNLRGSRLAFLTTFRIRAKLKTAKRARDYLKVLEFGEEILSRNPWDLGAQMDMGEAADALGHGDIAIFMLDQARQKFPKNATLNRALARLFEKRGNFAHAISLWQLVREVAPKDVEAQHKAKDLAASETIQRGQYEGGSGEKPAVGGAGQNNKPKEESQTDRVGREAAPILAKISANPTDPNSYIQLSAVYRRHSLLERARAVLEQGLGPTGNAYQLMVDIIEMDIEALRKDVAIAEEKIRKGGKSADGDEDDDAATFKDLQQQRTRLLKEINSREIELFRLKADRAPAEPSHHLELGLRLLRGDQVDEALKELQDARKNQKYAGRATMYLGFCFKKKNNWRLAQKNFEDALALIPQTDEANRKEVLFQLASGSAEAGDLAKAIDHGHELANLDFSYKNIGKMLDEWHERVQQD